VIVPSALEARFHGATPREIAAALATANARSSSVEDRDQRQPLWLGVAIPEGGVLEPTILELDILRFEPGKFWLQRTNDLGAVEYVPLTTLTSSRAQASKGGFSIPLVADTRATAVIGEVRSYMPGHPRALLWEPSDYEASERTFERRGGAIFGSLLVLAAFSAIVAFINRDITFLLFAGWLVTSLRVAAINAGWDKYWVQVELDNSAYLAILRVSIAAYGLFTVALFRGFLIRETDPPMVRRYFEVLQHGFLLFALAAPFVDHILFLRAFWAFAAVGLSTLTIKLAYSLIWQRTRLVGWYTLSWGSMIVGMASEIGAQSGVVDYPPWLNSQTASIVSALIMGLGLADRLRTERDARVAAKAESVTYLKKYEENFNSMPVGLFGLDSRGALRLTNPAFNAMFSLPASPVERGLSVDELLGSETFARLKAAAYSGHADIEIESPQRTGCSKWYLTRVTLNDGLVEGSIQDVSIRKAAEDQLKHLVDHDSLTGLLNRRGLDVALRNALDSLSPDKTCAIAYVDLDRFKLINDLHGHGTGDALLLQSAQRLKFAVRSKDQVARIADAFVVILHDCPENAMIALTERIREVISERPFDLEGKELNVTTSVGVVSIEQTMTAVDALAAADRACNEAKSRGRNCVVRLTDQDAALRSHLEELRVVADLQQHIPTERYFLDFQPIVALQSAASTLSYEVLIRMRGEQGQVIPPGKFIGAAERNGLMSQIDRWVLRSTLEWLDSHPVHRDRLAFATINISGASLNDNRFVDDAFSMIAEHPLAMPKLCFEITESVALHDLGSTRRFVDRVRMYGSKLALDDFGAGYTSFNYLKEIPADFIKIDGSFVKDINRNPANFAITRTIVELTHELGMRSIAEWAETPDTIAALIELGVDYGQGFGLVRPISPMMVADCDSCLSLVPDPVIVQMLRDGAVTPASQRTRAKARRTTSA
jgi:diguanylate cyclase (GGDEF)-like protein